MATLPTPRHVVASLISTIPLPQEPQSSSANPLRDTPDVKSLLLTLHVLFPNELLPALDLLDRALVTRLRLSPRIHTPPLHDELPSRVDTEADVPSDQAPGYEPVRDPVAAVLEEEEAPGQGTFPDATERYSEHTARNITQHAHGTKMHCTYYVRSAQQQVPRGNSRYRNAAYEHTAYYEVRLTAWSCSCPAFAFSAFPATASDNGSALQSTTHNDGSTSTPPDWVFGGLTLGTNMPVCKHLLACVLVEHSTMFAHFVEERMVSTEEMAGWAAGWGD